MATRFRFQSYPARLKSIGSVIETLDALDAELAGTDLAHLRAFNRTYLIITRNVAAAMSEGFFTDPAFWQRFDIRFAEYYFDALKDFVDGRTPAAAWHDAFAACLGARRCTLRQLALGVNAHVNNDIALALLDCAATDAHRRDFYRLNRIIFGSVPAVRRAVDDLPDRARPVYRFAIPYRLGMCLLMFLWRHNAWRKFEALRSQRLQKSGLNRSAHRRARLLQRTPFLA